jgi:hypothetical protein
VSTNDWGVGEDGTTQLVRIRLCLAGREKPRYTDVMTRLRAEQELADWMFYLDPKFEGDVVASALIEPYTHN